jgi:3-hydroxybenzoate 6-monooxygenase
MLSSGLGPIDISHDHVTLRMLYAPSINRRAWPGLLGGLSATWRLVVKSAPTRGTVPAKACDRSSPSNHTWRGGAMARVLIAGGGIGGLAAALSVAGSGHQAVVLERNATFAELGAGIQLAPNGIWALDRLGVGDRIRTSAVHIDELRFMDGLSGEHVISMPLGQEYQDRFGSPYVVAHRGDLYGVLLAACQDEPDIELCASSTVVGYEQDATGVRAGLSTGERIPGDALIGADGIRSTIRRQVVRDGEPRVAGITVYRAIVPMEVVPADLRWNAVSWWTGPGRHFVHYPVAGGRYLNLAPSHEDGASRAAAGIPVHARHVQGLFAEFAETPRRLLALGTDWKSWVLADRNPVQTWSDGRVVLLGDAAHPMLHYVAQGACQALEDAVLLGNLLECNANELPARFEAYAALRRERTAEITYLARRSIRLWHCAGPAAAERNRTLGAMSPSELHDWVAWMHRPPVNYGSIFQERGVAEGDAFQSQVRQAGYSFAQACGGGEEGDDWFGADQDLDRGGERVQQPGERGG